MEHQEYIRLVPGSDTAVLMIHGIVGSPAHFRDLMPEIPADWSVFNILLEGHGGTVEDFAASSMKKWKKQVNTLLQELFARYRQVAIVAHSMGTLFAIQAAIDHPEKISFLFLLNVPTRPWPRIRSALAAIRVTRGNIRPEDRIAWEMKNDTSIQLSPNLLKYLSWVPRFWELLWECRRVRKYLYRLKVPTVVFQSQADELVHPYSFRDLDKHACIETAMLSHSGHYAYHEIDAALLRQRFRQKIAGLQNNKEATI